MFNVEEETEQSHPRNHPAGCGAGGGVEAEGRLTLRNGREASFLSQALGSIFLKNTSTHHISCSHIYIQKSIIQKTPYKQSRSMSKKKTAESSRSMWGRGLWSQIGYVNGYVKPSDKGKTESPCQRVTPEPRAVLTTS